jgi:NADH-quinone oxidoreductase subunit H
LPPTLLTIIKAALVLAFQFSLIPLLVWVERKASAYMQDRTGPNRADIFGIRLAGLVHAIADVVKLIFKEDITPPYARRFYYRLAPFVALTIALLPMAVIPFADEVSLTGGHALSFQAVDLNIGLLYILAVGSFGVFGVIFAGWGSNSKYSLLGGLRASAQMISYELALALSIIGVLMVFQTVDLNRIVQQQGDLLFGFLPRWGVVVQPLAAVLFFTGILAETNRNPFDLPEGESEIVGYHVEYSSMKFAAFFMGEYAHIAAGSAVFATLFLGGWQIPWVPTDTLRANAGTALAVLLAATAVVSAALIPLLTRWRRRIRQLYTDRRRIEADVFRTASVLVLLLCLGLLIGGAWRGLGAGGAQTVAVIMQIMCFAGKVILVGCTFVWVRWTLPRFRYDQLMNLGWKNLVPLGIANVLATGFVLMAGS